MTFSQKEYSIIDESLGTGCSEVVRALHKESGKEYVAKIVEFEIRNEIEQRHMFFNESQLLRKFEGCPNIIQIEHSYIQDSKGIIILEKMDADLLEFILNESLSKDQKWLVFYKICEGVKQCHKMNVAHLDLKPENVLCSVSEKGGDISVKLIDFGTSQEMNEESTVFGPKGTLFYNSPEHFNQTSFGIDGRKVDIWSLGIILHVLLTGMWPLSSSDQNEIVCLISRCNLTLSEDLSKEEIKFISKLLHHNPKKRPTIQSVLKSSIFKEKVMKSDPAKQRISARMKFRFP